eukprot:scaffold28278_cov37-Prasinocladus_malaysianus.AAC.3
MMQAAVLCWAEGRTPSRNGHAGAQGQPAEAPSAWEHLLASSQHQQELTRGASTAWMSDAARRASAARLEPVTSAAADHTKSTCKPPPPTPQVQAKALTYFSGTDPFA